MVVPSGFNTIVEVIADDVPPASPRLDDTAVTSPDDAGSCEAVND